MNERLEPALKWCKENKERINAEPYEWYANNKDNINEYQRKYRKKSIKNLLTARIRSLLNYSLRYRNIKKEGNSKDILGYSIKQLEKKLAKTIPKGYTWQDFLNGKLDIDHIKPIKEFDYNNISDETFKECWNINNLRLLTVYDNRSR